MTLCESCQDQFLEYLYDLLDPTDRQKVELHIADCSNCQIQLQKARSQQNLLASAARLHFPNVQFVAPENEDANDKPKADVIPFSKRVAQSRRKPNWKKWIFAASVLITSAIAIPGGYFGFEFLDSQRMIRSQESTIASSQKQLKELREQLVQVMQKRDNELNKTVATREKQQLQVKIEGPSTVVPGFNSEFNIQVANLSNQLEPDSKIQARIVDDQGKPGDPIPLVSNGPGNYRAILPSQLTDLRPGLNHNLLNMVVSAQKENSYPAELTSKIVVHRPESMTYLATDKPVYQPGEVVYFRSLTIDKASLKPVQQPLSLTYTITPPGGGERVVAEGKDRLARNQGKGLQPVNAPDGKPLTGIGAGEFTLEPDVSGGEWTLVVREKNGRFLPVTRKFLVNQYQKPRLNKELDFTKKSFAPGEEYQAWCKATRADGGPLANQPVFVEVTIDGLKYNLKGELSNHVDQLTTDALGRVKVVGKLPQQIEKGQGSISIKFTDGGNNETLDRPLPIVLKDLQIEFFPEGGDLVADLPARVYFQARTPLGKPADIKALLLEDLEPTGIKMETLNDENEVAVNQGMGRFSFTPRAGKKYQIQIVSPPGINRPILLPEPLIDGLVMRIDQSILSGKEPLKVHFHTRKLQKYILAVYCRDRQVAIANLEAGQLDADIPLGEDVSGVCRVTAYAVVDKDGSSGSLKPLAERLIYRRPLQELNVVIKPNQNRYVPRQKVRLDVETLDQKESSTPAVVALSVVDKSVITLADEKTARSPTTYFLLTGGLKNGEELEYSDFLLTQKPHAADALDLLLGTRGWRRFVSPRSVASPNETNQFSKSNNELSGAGNKIPTPQSKLGMDHLPVSASIVNTPVLAKSAPSNQFERAIQHDQETITLEAQEQINQIKTEIDKANAIVALTSQDPGYLRAKQDVDQARNGLARIYSLLILVLLFIFFVLLVRAIYLTLCEVNLKGHSLAQLFALSILLFGLMGLTWLFLSQKFHLHQEVVLNQSPAEEPRAEAAAAAKDPPLPKDGLFKAAAGEQLKVADKIDDPHVLAQDAPLRDENQVKKEENARRSVGRKATPLAMVKPGNKQVMDLFGNNQEKIKPMALNGVAAPAAARGGLIAKDEAKAGEFRKGKGPNAGMGGGAMQKRLLEVDRDADLVFREYAHQNVAAPEATRTDFAETLYWHPALVMDHGKGSISFDLSDSVTSFQVTAFAHTLDGRFGTGSYLLESRLPFTLQPKIPLEVTSSDEIMVPLSVSNNTSESQEIQVELVNSPGLKLETDSRIAKLSVEAEKARRQLFGFRPSITGGEASIEYRGRMAGHGNDAIRTGFRVVPLGFPALASQSDLLEGTALAKIHLPKTWVPGSLLVKAEIYPSTLATLQKGLEGLLREPNGCFEQSSTTNYPNVLVLNYLRESNATQPDLEKQTRNLLERGYQRLISFECQTSNQQRLGYEWFGGQAPPHEALTAYGLMQFHDMARVFDVDQDMVKRTQDYLLKQRDGRGGFHRNPRALDSFGRAPEDITNAYILWALTESGVEDNLDLELKTMADKAAPSKDPYFLGLVANSLINRGQTEAGTAILERLVTLRKPDGHLDGAVTSITGSGGQALQIETTSLAILGWLKAQPGKFNSPVEKAINWLTQQRGGHGAFGSTQSTILALKALISHTRANKKTAEAGEISLFVGDNKVNSKAFSAGASGTLVLEVPEPEKVFKAGENPVRLEITGKNVFPYTISWSYSTTLPSSNRDCKVQMQTNLANQSIEEGETVSLDVKLKNLTKSGLGMTTAIIGIPGGLSLPEDLKQLKDLTRLPEDGSRPRLGAFEIRGRELILHWRDMAPEEELGLKLNLIGRVPGKYTGPASRAYLYYTAEQKNWIAPLEVTIRARN